MIYLISYASSVWDNYEWLGIKSPFLDQTISHELSLLPANLGMTQKAGGKPWEAMCLWPLVLSWVVCALDILPAYSISVYPFMHPDLSQLSLFSHQIHLFQSFSLPDTQALFESCQFLSFCFIPIGTR